MSEFEVVDASSTIHGMLESNRVYTVGKAKLLAFDYHLWRVVIITSEFSG